LQASLSHQSLQREQLRARDCWSLWPTEDAIICKLENNHWPMTQFI